MIYHAASAQPRRTRPAVEQLEDRCLLSVSVLPTRINFKSPGHSRGPFAVVISGDTPAGQNFLLDDPSTLDVSIAVKGTTLDLGTPLMFQITEDANLNIIQLQLMFDRSLLQDLPSGPVALTLTDGTDSEMTTFTVVARSSHGGHHTGHRTSAGATLTLDRPSSGPGPV
jgi:hypothetical protein